MAIHAPSTSPHAIHAARHPTRIRSWLTHEGTHVAVRLVAVTVAALSGAVTATVMPRGPVTTEHALLLMVIGLATGLTVAFLMRSRWAMLAAPLLHVLVFELVRLDETGPTVDGPSFDTAYGVLALLLGRGVYALLGIAPMILGAAYGAGLARWLLQEHPGNAGAGVASNVRRAIGALATVGMIGLVIRIVRPASVPPVTGADGEPIDGSIAELMAVNLGGHEQWIEVRGASEHLPVLLYISGGPGQSDLAFSRVLLNDLTRDFIVVGWDQRGNGKSYPSLDPESLTLDCAVADTVELSEFLCKRFGQERIYVLGESWGSTLGVLAAQKAPHLYYAYMGSGQMVSQRLTDQIIYDDLLAWAETNGDEDLVEKLRDAGPPPYESLWMYAEVAVHYDKLAGGYDPPQAYLDRAEAGDVGPWGVLGSEYTAMDSVNVMRGLADTFFVMYPQLQEIDFRTDVPALEMPVYLLEGEHELRGRLELAEEWFSMLKAPHKEIYILPNAGHAPAFEHADEFHRMLLEEILPRTYPTA
jgi:pimeloyl-ACP methyl ester carboxylesterase